MELLLFSDRHCIPCVKLKNILNRDEIKFTEIDIEKEPEKTNEFNIGCVPTLIRLDGNEIKGKLAGLHSKTSIYEFLEMGEI